MWAEDRIWVLMHNHSKCRRWDDAFGGVLSFSVHSGHTSAVHVTARYGSASRTDPLYQAVVHLGRLLRTVFLCDYFLNNGFRREMQALADAHRGHQPARRVPFPGRALRRQMPTVCYCTENERIPS
jgi:TnpA family transposase